MGQNSMPHRMTEGYHRPGPRPVNIAVVDDHQVVLDGVRAWVASDPLQRLRVVADGYWVDSVLAGPGRNADVLVLDLGIFNESVADRVSELARARILREAWERGEWPLELRAEVTVLEPHRRGSVAPAPLQSSLRLLPGG